ncbi:TIGR01244 family phosphatase [Peteryoungia desertarenae]|uniref:TIGR01244 family phosphatase n=1 Tax=Peteryoungia desertarenae TaxID=1813451 RepID=A0ABX6QLG2_9HYPH|nr:TIGR01244 family sulfur transferase [Peteryoungia desertarenae]QLF69312.1 TIGR01244 family phosphatase [Peteryoungia desertarenae]
MRTRPLTARYHVTGQLQPKDMQAAAAEGYQVVLCMRPDGEGWGQPKFAAIAEAAKASGIEAHYLPVGGNAVPMEQAAKLKAILRETEGKVLAYCASGARSSGLYQMAQSMPG